MPTAPAPLDRQRYARLVARAAAQADALAASIQEARAAQIDTTELVTGLAETGELLDLLGRAIDDAVIADQLETAAVKIRLIVAAIRSETDSGPRCA